MEKRIRVSPGLFLLIAALIAFDSDGRSLWLLLSAAIHELGHMCAIAACGRRLGAISAEITGLRISYSGKGTYLADFIGAAAGPLCNLATAALCSRICPEMEYFIGLNLLLCLVNLLPALPLDGGRMVLAVLEYRFGPDKGIRACRLLGLACALMVLACAAYVSVRVKLNLSLLAFSAMLLAGNRNNVLYNPAE